MEIIQATVVRVRYENPSRNWRICIMKGRNGELFGQTFTAVGDIPVDNRDELLDLDGEWVENEKYGRQFEAKNASPYIPSTSEGIAAYLAKKVKGLGKVKAATLADHFGIALEEILDETPSRLAEVPGLNPKLVSVISKVWADGRAMRQIDIFLTSNGIEAKTWSKRIYEQFGACAVGVLKNNPYKLAKIDGIGFKKADAMAAKLGVPKTSPLRIDAAFTHILQESTNDGHTFLHRDVLVKRVAALAGGNSGEIDPGTGAAFDVFHALPRPQVEAALQVAIERGDMIEDRYVFNKTDHTAEYLLEYLPYLFHAESNLAKRIVELLEVPSRNVSGVPALMTKAQKAVGLPASVDQHKAAIAAINNSFSIITGGPGTGKSTITKMILSCMEDLGWDVKMAAPTGRAAKRLMEVTGHAASTIHKLLEFDPKLGKFTRNKSNPIEADAVIFDEMSMADTVLMGQAMAAIPRNCHVILLGDVDQLPSVGPGMVLKDLIQCGHVTVTILKENFRQAQGSLIARNAGRILHGENPIFLPKGQESDCFLMEVPLKLDGNKATEDIGRLQTKEESGIPGYVHTMLGKVCKESIPARYGVNPIQDIQVLVPMKKGTAGVHELNKVLQDALNPDGAPIQFGKQEFRVGDRIMVFKNNYELDTYNGDIGFVQGLTERQASEEDENPDEAVSTLLYTPEEIAELSGDEVVEPKKAKTERILKVLIDGNLIYYPEKDGGDLQLAYCQTIHKSQGSEFPVVILILANQHYNMLERNLIYTALTRAKDMCLFLASKKALGMAVSRCQVKERNSLLGSRIKLASARSMGIGPNHRAGDVYQRTPIVSGEVACQ